MQYIYPLRNTSNQHLKENNLYSQKQQFHHQQQSNSIKIREFTSPERKPSMTNTEFKINQIYQSPDMYINQLKGDVDCWELRYKSLEKKFSSMLILESEVESKNREIQDLHNKMQMERNQNQIVVIKLEDRLVGLEKENISLEEQISSLRLRSKVIAKKENHIDMRDIQQKIGFTHNNTDEIQRKERQQQKQIQEYCSQILNLQNQIENLIKSDQLEQNLDFMREEKLKSQEFDSLKQITKEKEEIILSQQSLIQQLQEKNEHLVDSIEGVNTILKRRQEEFQQFKKEVEKEVESRISLMIDENDSLRQVILSKNQEQSLKNHYQKQFVNGQIENEINVDNLNQKISVLEQQAKQHQQQIQIHNDDYQQNIRLLNQEYQRKQEDQYKSYESIDILVGQLKQECNQLRQQGEDWKQNFILMNRQFHKKQEEIVLLQTEVEALNSLKLSICKQKSSFITKGLY